MYQVRNEDINLVIKYHDDIDTLIDIIKVMCNDAYYTGMEDSYTDNEER